MPQLVCKTIIDAARAQAAAQQLAALAAGAERALVDGIKAGDIAADDQRAVELSMLLCEWAERMEAWSADTFARLTALVGWAGSGPPPRRRPRNPTA
jgi:hypothetical protein